MLSLQFYVVAYWCGVVACCMLLQLCCMLLHVVLYDSVSTSCLATNPTIDVLIKTGCILNWSMLPPFSVTT